MSKELNIIEAGKMPNTEFKVIYQSGKESLHTFTDEFGNFINYEKDREECYFKFIQAKFIPIEKPVSFMEAIKQNHYNNKTIRCEVNDKIYTYEPVEIKTTEVRAKETNGGISTEEILNGKWYVED